MPAATAAGVGSVQVSSAAGARGPSRPTAAQVDLEALRQATALLVTSGAQAAIESIRRHAIGRSRDELHVLLVRMTSGAQTTHPQAGLEVTEVILRADPECMPAWTLRCLLLDRVGRRAEAFAATRKVVGSPKSLPNNVLTAANLMVRLGDEERALAAACKAFDDLGRPLRHVATLLYIAQRCADWETCDRLVAQLTEAYAAGRVEDTFETPRTHLLWCADEATNIQVVSAWSRRAMPQVAPQRPAAEPLQGRRIRVGYLSSDFREHPTSRLILGLLRHHDRSRFDVTLYCSGWDDGSPMRREVEACVDRVHTVTPLGDQAAAELIRSHRIDVLIELNGPTRAHRMGILAHGAAPVQIDYLGWPGSVGGRVVDYVIGDPTTVPDAALALYPEKVIRIQSVYQINDYAARVRPPKPTRAALGLPEGRPVLGMFNALNKVGGEVWRTWMRILREAPEAVLWVLDPGGAARDRLMRSIAEHGLDASQLVFAPKMDQEPHLARLQCCDLMLDPWPYGGHTSTADALFAGVPVIAMGGTNFAGRVSGALLAAAGLKNLVAKDTESYVALALRMIRNRTQRESAHRWIRERVMSADVFNARSKTRQMEAAYRIALERAIAGEAPRHITISTRPAPA